MIINTTVQGRSIMFDLTLSTVFQKADTYLYGLFYFDI